MGEEDDVLRLLSGGGFGGGNIASAINDQFGIGINLDNIEFNTEHAENAVDFENISLTDESDHGEEINRESHTPLLLPVKTTPSYNYSQTQQVQDREAIQRAAMEKAEAQRKRSIEEARLLKYYYPLFSRNDRALKMHTIFKLRPNPKSRLAFFNSHAFKHHLNKPLIPLRTSLAIEGDGRKLFNKRRKHEEGVRGNIILVSESDLEKVKKNGDHEEKTEEADKEKDVVLATADWDDDVILGGKIEEIHNDDTDALKIDGDSLYDFEEFQVPEDVSEPAPLNLKLDMNDPKLLFAGDFDKPPKKGKNTLAPPTSTRLLLSRFDVSNDSSYELLKNNYHSKIRATLASLAIDHAMPAQRLQLPFYKVKLTKQQMRHFHRPKFIVRLNTAMYFSKPKLRKRKRDRGKDPKESFYTTADLTLGDTAPFYLFEYSEQQPLVLLNFGMGSKIINYYRKRTEDDTYRPKGLIGETHVLGTADKLPFWNFGFVDKGTFVPTLYNQMARAPVFQHEPESTDFLLIRSLRARLTRYYLRSITKTFLVGQMYPVVEIPGPHSRKVTTVSKNRLKMIVYRVLNQLKKQRLAVKDISAHFPDQNDMQNRQRLKEFMVYQRTGEDQGFWKIKPGEKLPQEDEIRAMIAPEDLCLLESMQVGQQHLADYSVYSFDNINLEKYQQFISKFNEKDYLPLDDEEEEEKKDDSGEGLEEQLAPWNTTKNFINATQGKAMLQLHGEGEPTGIKEGISFLRTSMKGGFKALDPIESAQANGHSYNVALQQKAYDEEIRKTWDQQTKALSSDEPRKYGNEKRAKSRYYSRPKKTVPKVLRITRMVRNQYGVLERKTEEIKDERIINAYLLRKKEQFEEIVAAQTKDSNLALDLSNVEIPKNEDEKKLLEQQLEKLQAQKANNSSKVLQSGKGIGKGKNTKRKCALCGEVGHIRTKKSCPMYGKENN